MPGSDIFYTGIAARMHKYFIFALLFACITGASASTAPLAVQLSANHLKTLEPRGPDAIAGLDDWLLSNGTLCATISDIGHETGMTPWGGALIDVFHCGRGDDQWPFQHTLINLDKDTPLEPTRIAASSGGTKASITVTSKGYGLILNSRYHVDSQQPKEMIIDQELVRVDDGKPVTMFGFLMLHPHLSLTPYSISTQDAQFSQGFHFESLDRTDRLAMVKAMNPADLHVLVGRSALSAISYGIQLEQALLIDADGEERALSRFQLTDPTYSMQGVLSRPPWIGGEGKLGLSELLQSRLMDIKPGETLKIRQRIYLGDRADVASVSDQIYRGRVIHGSVDTNDAMIHLRNSDGHPITGVRPDKDNQFSARLPENTERAELTVKTPWGETGAEVANLGKNEQHIQLSINSAQSFAVLPKSGPMRLIFKGLGDTPDPDFNDDFLGFQIDGQSSRDTHAANYISMAGIANDTFIVAIKPGKYRVYATRGMKYSVTTQDIDIPPGDTAIVNIDPPVREIAAENWLAADFHVHAAPSFDSAMPINDRLRSFVAQGSDVLIATEHNVLVDYQDRVSQLGLGSLMNVVNGVELTGFARTATTPYTNGHLNVFPTRADKTAFAGGLPRHEGKRLRDVYHTIRTSFRRALIQLNHPRLSDPLDVNGDNSYFENLISGEAYDHTLALDSTVNRSLIERDKSHGLRDLDVDLMEIANGKDYQNYLIMKRDWFSLLNQGEKIFGSANSDTHGYQQLVAIPQNFVRASLPFNENQFIESIRSGAFFGTTGPFLGVTATAEGHGQVEPGGTLSTRRFTLNIQASAAGWVPVDSLSVYSNGALYHQQPISAGDTISLPIEMDRDGYVIVELLGKADEVYSAIAPGFTPFAFSNPIFVSTRQ